MGGDISLVNRTPLPIMFYEISGDSHSIGPNTTSNPSSPAQVWYSTRIKADCGEEIMPEWIMKQIDEFLENAEINGQVSDYEGALGDDEISSGEDLAELLNQTLAGIYQLIAILRVKSVKWKHELSGITFYITGDKKEGVYFGNNYDTLYISIQHFIINKKEKTGFITLLLSTHDYNIPEYIGFNKDGRLIPKPTYTVKPPVKIIPPEMTEYRLYNMTPFKWNVIFTPNGTGTGNNGKILCEDIIYSNIPPSWDQYHYLWIKLIKNVGYNVKITMDYTDNKDYKVSKVSYDDLSGAANCAGYIEDDKSVLFIQNNNDLSWYGHSTHKDVNNWDDKKRNKIINYFTNGLWNDKDNVYKMFDKNIFVQGTTLKHINHIEEEDSNKRAIFIGVKKWIGNTYYSSIQCQMKHGYASTTNKHVMKCVNFSLQGTSQLLPKSGPPGYSTISGADEWDSSVFKYTQKSKL